jgi:hypothetical protein
MADILAIKTSIRGKFSIDQRSRESQGKVNEVMGGDDADQIFHISRIWNIFFQTGSAL